MVGLWWKGVMEMTDKEKKELERLKEEERKELEYLRGIEERLKERIRKAERDVERSYEIKASDSAMYANRDKLSFLKEILGE